MLNLEFKKTASVFIATGENFLVKWISRIGSYTKLTRILGYMYKFFNLCKTQKRSKQLSSDELHFASLKLFEIIQRNEYVNEYDKIKKAKPLQPGLQALTPFVQKFSKSKRRFSLIRVGGRLLNAPLSHNSKFPNLLPNKTKIWLKHIFGIYI